MAGEGGGGGEGEERRLIDLHGFAAGKNKFEIYDCECNKSLLNCILTFSNFYFVDRVNRSYICAVGFEPNPAHTEGLEALQKAYADCGYD